MTTQWHWIKVWLVGGICLVGAVAPAEPPEEEGDSGFRWWWSDDEADREATDDEDRPWMVTSPLANVSWPEIRMPKVEFRPFWSTEENAENGDQMVTPLSRAREATRGAIDRTRTAWNSAIDRMKFALPGGKAEDDAQIASSDPGPTFWERLFGDDTSEPQGPNSVGELMAKEPSPTRSRLRR